jgi:hypothetical protein
MRKTGNNKFIKEKIEKEERMGEWVTKLMDLPSNRTRSKYRISFSAFLFVTLLRDSQRKFFSSEFGFVLF